MQTLSRITHPETAQDFLCKTYGKDYLLIQNQETNRFQDLITWEDLNHLLSYSPLRHPHVRMLKDGKPVAPEEYLLYQPSRFRSEVAKHRLLPHKIETFLSSGATLVIDELHMLLPQISRFAASLERELGDTVQVNGYLGWNGAKGFTDHWDSHDVFVLQLYGEKQWYVYECTRPHPLASDLDAPAWPTKTHWSGRLTAGDMLYLPRGYWHAAQSVDGPTFHLTVGVKRKTGIDYLHWLVDQLVAQPEVRNNLPRKEWASDADFSNSEEVLLAQLQRVISETGNLSQYLDAEQSLRMPLRGASLPFRANGELDDETLLESNLARRVVIQHSSDQITVSAGGIELTLPKIALPLFRLINRGEGFTVTQAHATLTGVSLEEIRATLLDLMEKGWIRTACVRLK